MLHENAFFNGDIEMINLSLSMDVYLCGIFKHNNIRPMFCIIALI